MIAGLLFDKDGTLFDFNASWSAWASNTISDLSEGNAARKSALAHAIGFDLEARRFFPDSGAIAGTLSWIVDQMAPHVSMSRPALETYLIEATSVAPMVPAVALKPLMAEFRRRGLRIGVATNDAEASARAHLTEAGIVEDFHFIAGYDSGFGAKPEPGMILAFAEQMNLSPTQVLMVGDSTHDLSAGRAAGAQTLGVLTGPATEADLALWADAILPDIGAIPDWLEAHPR